MYDAVIIGAGIIGSAAAYVLSKYDLRILVLDKENDVAMGTTRANSAIIHAGYDPKPGTMMASLNVEGAELTKKWCEELQISYKQCGSLVLAFTEEDRKHLEQLLWQGGQNGVEGLRIVEADELFSMEPMVNRNSIAALYAPTAGIINPWEFTLHLMENAVKNGIHLERNQRVNKITKENTHFVVYTDRKEFTSRYIFNAAGVYADFVHNLIASPTFSIKPEKGEYFILDKSEGSMVNHVIFQCPTEKGKGILVSPTVHGNLLIGPNSEITDDPEDVSTTGSALAMIEATARLSVPEINITENIRNFAGLRAVTEETDFIISEAVPGFFDLAGIKSPGYTSAPAIAKMAVKFLAEKIHPMRKKTNWKQYPAKKPFRHMSAEEKKTQVKENPLYGHVLCRCETVTEGEIRDIMHMAVAPVSVDGIKRRCGTGMGRCQGGFCGPQILKILAEEMDLSPTEMIQDKQDSIILREEI